MLISPYAKKNFFGYDPSDPELVAVTKTLDDTEQLDPLSKVGDVEQVFDAELDQGFYPVSHDGRWHGGVHLKPPEQSSPVRAIANGIIVAYRVSKASIPHKNQEGKEVAGWESDNSFVLIKHELKGKDSKRAIVFYSLYMHLASGDAADNIENAGRPAAAAASSKKKTASAPKPKPGGRLAELTKVGYDPAANIAVRAGAVLGYTGRMYGERYLHFEIFSLDADFETYFVDSKEKNLKAKHDGVENRWGDTYYVIPKSAAKFAAGHPKADAAGKIGEANFPAGTAGELQEHDYLLAHVRFSEEISLVTKKPGKQAKNYEFAVPDAFTKHIHVWGADASCDTLVDLGSYSEPCDLCTLSQALYPPKLLRPPPPKPVKAKVTKKVKGAAATEPDPEPMPPEPVAVPGAPLPVSGMETVEAYELLRYGRNVRFKPAVLPANEPNHQLLRYTASGEAGYIDLSQKDILKLSDADFPFFMGWGKVDDDLVQDDGICDSQVLTKLMQAANTASADAPAQGAAAGDDPLTAKEWAAYLKNNPAQRKKLRYMICHSPSEWDKRLNAKFDKLKEEKRVFHGKDAAFDRFVKFIEQFQFWSEVKELGSGPAWHFHPLQFIQHFSKFRPNPVLWLEIARKDSGVVAIKGATHEDRVIEYHATTSKDSADEVPWCSSFVNWVLKQSNMKGTNSPGSATWVANKWGKDFEEAYGTIYVLWHNDGTGGHVGFVIGRNVDQVKYVLFGGNQHNSVDYSSFPNGKDTHSGTRAPSSYEPLDVDFALETYVNISNSTATH